MMRGPGRCRSQAASDVRKICLTATKNPGSHEDEDMPVVHLKGALFPPEAREPVLHERRRFRGTWM
jgi:hypothetical protein